GHLLGAGDHRADRVHLDPGQVVSGQDRHPKLRQARVSLVRGPRLAVLVLLAEPGRASRRRVAGAPGRLVGTEGAQVHRRERIRHEHRLAERHCRRAPHIPARSDPAAWSEGGCEMTDPFAFPYTISIVRGPETDNWGNPVEGAP